MTVDIMLCKQYTRPVLFTVTLVMFVTIMSRNVKYVTQELTSWNRKTSNEDFLLERGPSKEWIRERTVSGSAERHGTSNHDENQNNKLENRQVRINASK